MAARRLILVKAITFITLALALILFNGAAAANADTPSPIGHEPFAGDSQVCYVCHRTHTATTANLLRSAGGMCLTCHKNGVGADTDVTSGKYTVSSPPRHDPPMGENGNLLAGGFAQLDTNGDGSLEPQAYAGTSQHKVGMTIAPFGSTYNGAYAVLECSSCHSMHEDPANPGQYRYLRVQVGDKTDLQVTWNGPWTDSTQTTHQDDGYRAYTERDFNYVNADDKDIQEYTRNYQSGMSAWCSGCHSVYKTQFGPYDIGDGQGSMIRHKHKIDMTLTNTGDLGGLPATDLPLNDLTGNSRTNDDTMICLTCHRAHGTDTDSTAVGAYQASSRGVLPSMNTSMLLRLNNRGVCINCHGYLND